MEPFTRTGVIVASNHFAETDFITVAVPRFALLVFVVAFVERLVVGGYCRLWDGFLLAAFCRGRVLTSGGPRALSGLCECGEHWGRCLGIASLGRLGLSGSRLSIPIFTLGTRCSGCSTVAIAFIVTVCVCVRKFIFGGSVPGYRSGIRNFVCVENMINTRV